MFAATLEIALQVAKKTVDYVDLVAGESKPRMRLDESPKMPGGESAHDVNLSAAAGRQHTLLIDLQCFAETHGNHSDFTRCDVSLGD